MKDRRSQDLEGGAAKPAIQLDRILLAEAQIERDIADARAEAKLAIENAHRQASDIKEQAAREGQRAGELQASENLSRFEEGLQQRLASFKQMAEEQFQAISPRLDDPVEKAVSFVLGLTKERLEP